jgi:hypothetical protein
MGNTIWKEDLWQNNTYPNISEEAKQYTINVLEQAINKYGVHMDLIMSTSSKQAMSKHISAIL